MSERFDSQKNVSGNFRQLLQERIEKTNPRRKLTTEETNRLAKLESIADKLKRGENVQNRQLQTWLSEDECPVSLDQNSVRRHHPWGKCQRYMLFTDRNRQGQQP
jgi:hypothetical protein